MRPRCAAAALLTIVAFGGIHNAIASKVETSRQAEQEQSGSVLLELAAKGELVATAVKPEWPSNRPPRHHPKAIMRKHPPRHAQTAVAAAKQAWLAQAGHDSKVAEALSARMTACQVTPEMTACNQSSKDACRWPEPKKFDLLISWWTNSAQSNIHEHQPPSFLQESATSRFENQAEIKYALRSYEKYGLLDHVDNIYLLIDQITMEQFGAPRFFNYSNRGIHIVTDRDMGVQDTPTSGSDKWKEFLALDKIKGLSDYFLWLPDDVFLMKPFKMDSLYNSDSGKPSLYSFGTFALGWCDGMHAVGSTHGPVFMNKCAYSAVADKYFRTHGDKMIDVPCLYTNGAMAHSDWKGPDTRFHRECHTNAFSGCNPYGKDRTPLFMNVQGNGISDEYAANPAKEPWGLKSVFPHGAQSWFHEEFPKPSRFEV